MKRAFLIILFIVFSIIPRELIACHAMPLLNCQIQTVGNYLSVTADSDPATCGCSLYFMQVEIVKASESLTGSVAGSPYVHLTGPQFYTSPRMSKPNCVQQTYPSTNIPLSTLCSGTTYQIRMRECHNGQVGPWSATFNYFTPITSFGDKIILTASDTVICPSTSINLKVSLQAYCGTPGTYSWNTGAGNVNQISVSPNTTTTYVAYYITPTDTFSDSVSVQVFPNTAILSGPSFVCESDTIKLSVAGFNGNTEWQYSYDGINWPTLVGVNVIVCSTNDTVSTIVSQPVYYRVKYLDQMISSCNQYSNVLFVNFENGTNVSISGGSTICQGSSTTLTASGGNSYQWYPANGLSTTSGSSVSASPTQTTIYAAVGTGNCGIDTSYKLVQVNNLPSVILNSVTDQCADGATVALVGDPAGGTFFGNGVSGNSFEPSLAGAGDHLISYSYTDGSGCSDTASINIHVDVCTGLGRKETLSANIFPNPAMEGSEVILDGIKDATILITSPEGRTIKRIANRNGQVNMNYPAGVYFITIQDNYQLTKTFRLVVLK